MLSNHRWCTVEESTSLQNQLKLSMTTLKQNGEILGSAARKKLMHKFKSKVFLKRIDGIKELTKPIQPLDASPLLFCYLKTTMANCKVKRS